MDGNEKERAQQQYMHVWSLEGLRLSEQLVLSHFEKYFEYRRLFIFYSRPMYYCLRIFLLSPS